MSTRLEETEFSLRFSVVEEFLLLRVEFFPDVFSLNHGVFSLKLYFKNVIYSQQQYFVATHTNSLNFIWSRVLWELLGRDSSVSAPVLFMVIVKPLSEIISLELGVINIPIHVYTLLYLIFPKQSETAKTVLNLEAVGMLLRGIKVNLNLNKTVGN